MPTDQDLIIRPVSENELSLLPREARPDDHRKRFYQQQMGKSLYLIAWLGELPVGQLLLTWDGEQREPMGSGLEHCPTLSDFVVQPAYRSRGVGSRMLDYVERVVLQQEYQQIGLGVSMKNPRARSLYERRGYRDAGLGSYLDSWSWIDEQGQEYLVIDRCLYLVKPLQKEHIPG